MKLCKLKNQTYTRTHLHTQKKTFSPHSDNPLICSCELIWFPELLQSLKDRDDEMTQKKRPMCLMASEHREYFVQSMPLERMNCVGKPLVNSQLNSDATMIQFLIPLSVMSMISLYF